MRNSGTATGEDLFTHFAHSAEAGGPGGCGTRGAPGDPSDGDAGLMQADNAHAVEDRELLGLGAVGVDLDGAVGQDTIHVHGEQADGGPTGGADLGFPAFGSTHGWI